MIDAREKPYRLLTIGVGLVVLISFLGAIGASKLVWGYFLRRPRLDRRMHQVERVISLTAFRSERGADGEVVLVPDEPYRIYDDIGACSDEAPSRSYYCLRGRALVGLADRGALPGAPDRLSSEELARLYGLLEGTGRLRPGAPGYEHAKELAGLVLEAEVRGGRRLLFVAASGRQVSNDHYPYYEFLFRVPARGAEPRLLSHRRFYYDVAGMEGAEWPVAFVALLLLGTLLLALALVVRAAIDTYKGKDALRTVTAVTVLVLSVALTLTLSLGGCEMPGPRPISVPATATVSQAARTVTGSPAGSAAASPTAPHGDAATRMTVMPTLAPTSTHTPTPTPAPTQTPAPTRIAQPESLSGSLVLYVEGGGLRSIPHRSLFDHPELQHIYDPGIGQSELGMYLVGFSPVTSADGRWLVITDPLPSGPDIQPGTTWLGDLATGELTGLGRPALAPTWSPKGHRMTYVLDETLYVWDVGGDHEPVAIFGQEGLRHLYARWSPTGEWIAVAGDAQPKDWPSPIGMWTYWLVSPDGSRVKELGTWPTSGHGAAPQGLDWSPDGKLLDTPSAVVLTVEGEAVSAREIREHPPASVPARYVPWLGNPDMTTYRRHAWLSHNGQQIAYESQLGRLHLFDRESETDTLIATFDSVGSLQVRWSEDDGTLIVGTQDKGWAEEGVFWGRISTLKPEAESVPELLVEGEDIYLVDVIPALADQVELAPTAGPTATSTPTPTATPEPTPTPTPMKRIESIPGSLVLYVQEGGPRSVPHRSLFDHPDLQHIYGEHVRIDSLMRYLVGGSPIPSADGRYVVITGPYPSGPEMPRTGTTWLGDLLTGELTALGPPALDATWSPEGHQMTYILDETLYVWDVASEDEPVAIFQREGLLYRYARWSPAGDQQRIAVASREGPKDRGSALALSTYWLVSLDGSEVRELGTWLTGGMCAVPQLLDWSPDGRLLDTPSAVVITLDGQELHYNDLYENPPPSAPARFAARFVDEHKIPDQRWAWMSHDERRIAYWGHDGLYVFDRGLGTDTLIATNELVDPLDRQWHMEVYWSMDDSTLIVPVHNAPRAGAREFWGQILAFKPEAGSQPELLAEGADLFLADVIPDVLDEESPRAAPASEVPLEETPQATPTLVAPQPVPTQVVVQVPGSAFAEVSLTYNQPIAETVQATIAPETLRGPVVIAPAHARFRFDGYILPDSQVGPRIEVYPVAEFGAISRQTAQRIADLRQVLAVRPAEPPRPLHLPMFHHGLLLRAQVAYLDLEWGTGVRFLTVHDAGPVQIDEKLLFYTFQGLTHDGSAYISAILPVSHPSLPVHLGAWGNKPGLSARTYDTYVTIAEEWLSTKETSSFAPALDQLDALIRSLEVR